MKKLLTLVTLYTLSLTAQANAIVVSIAPFTPQAATIIKACSPLATPGLTPQQTMAAKQSAVPCAQKGLVNIQVTLSVQLSDNINFQRNILIPAQQKYADLMAQSATQPVSQPPLPTFTRSLNEARTTLSKERTEFKRLLRLLSEIRADEARMISFLNSLNQ